jgi:hypothetical protein
MTRPRLYHGLVAAAALTMGAVILAAPASERMPLALGAGLALALQAPLGLAVLRSLGTERFLTVWGLGLLARFGLVAAAAFVIVPVLGWPAAPVLLALVISLIALLGVEAVAATLNCEPR